MPRRTALDTIFDNENAPGGGATPADMEYIATAANQEADHAFTQDRDDEALSQEGYPGDLTPYEEPNAIPDDEYQALIAQGIEAAESYIDSNISPDREEAAKFYRGDLFGNEVENRSQVVMTEVRDTVLAVMPALLRVFCGTKNAVEFIANQGTSSEQAKTQTAYINHIIHNDNPGFTIFHSAFKDALVRRTGIFTWWLEEKETVEKEYYTGINEEGYQLLQDEKDNPSESGAYERYEIEVLDARPDPIGEMLQPGAQRQIYDLCIHKAKVKKRHRVAAVPPEEFILTPSTSNDLDTYQLVGRRQRKTIGELVALGHSEAEIRDAVGKGEASSGLSLSTNAEAISRDPAVTDRLFQAGFGQHDPASEYVKYCVLYVLIDRDGDGIPERRKVVTVGDNNKIIYDNLHDDSMVNFALICPDPEPHSPFGYSLADQTMDMQEIKSEIMRGVLDGLAESVVGRTAIVEGQVNIDDALSADRDQLIRIRSPGAIQTLSKPFTGMNSIPVLQYLDDVKARRTGITMSPAGLAADTLQSTDSTAAEAVVDASQERTEMIARIFAETGVKRLFRGLLQQVVRNQDQAREIRLRGKPVTVDPRAFVADLDLETNVGLGRGTSKNRIGGLVQILAQQKEIMQTYGAAGQELIGLDHISNTVEDLMLEMDFADVSRYMNVISPERAQQIKQEAQNAPKQPTPEELLLQGNREKLQADMAKTKLIEQNKRDKTVLDDQAKHDKLIQDRYMKIGELLGKFGLEVSAQEIEAKMREDEAADEMAKDAIAAGEAATAKLEGPK